jgi:hypothetical protein
VADVIASPLLLVIIEVLVVVLDVIASPLLLVIVEVLVVVLVEGTKGTSNMSTTALYAVDYE